MLLAIYTKNIKEDMLRTGIYKIEHIDKPNKYYVGSAGIVGNNNTNQGFYLRWRLHLWELKGNHHHNIKLQNTVNKYGLNGIRFTILEYTSDKVEELTNREQYWIDLLDSYKNGYNILPFARTTRGRKVENPTNIKSVSQYSISGELINTFKSARKANLVTGISYKDISQCCLGQSYSARGFIWRFEKDSFNKYKIKMLFKNLPIGQYSIDNILIKEWNSITEISKVLGFSLGNLSSCIHGKRKSANGYIWKILDKEKIERERRDKEVLTN